MIFQAVEHEIDTLKPTGRVEHYDAANIIEAVEKCRYTHALKGPVHLGLTGRTIYCPSESIVFAVGPARGPGSENKSAD